MKLAIRFLNNTPIGRSGWPQPDNRHRLYVGASGYGKSGAMLIDAQASLDDGTRGVHVIDIESELVPPLIAYIARRTPWRRVHLLDSSSRKHAFSLPLLHVADPRDAQACHNVAVRALAVIEQVANFGADQLGPRMTKYALLGLFVLARTGRPFAVLPELYSSRANIRAMLAEALPYEFMRDAFNALDELPLRQMLDYVDALMSRLLPLLGSPVNRRVFNSTNAIDLARIIADRDVVLMPLGHLEHKDAVLHGSAFYSLLHHTALDESLDIAATSDIYIDEVANFLTPDLARGFDRLRKRKKYLRVACQRLTSFQKPDDPDSSVLSAVLTNCRTKVVMGGLPPDDAELMARLVFTGHFDLDTIYKENSRRPVVVGQSKTTLTSRAEARHLAEQHATAISDSHSTSHMRAISDAASTGWGVSAATGSGHSSSNAIDGTLLSPPTQLSQSQARNVARGRSSSGSISHVQVAAEQSARAHARSESRGRAEGRSQVIGTHEAMISEYALLETESYSLEEKTQALTGYLMNLAPRQCLVKVDGNSPVPMRTPDLAEPFKSPAFRAHALALLADKLAQSPYLRPIDVVDAEIAAAIAALTQPEIPDPDLSEPEPSPRLRVVNGDNDQ